MKLETRFGVYNVYVKRHKYTNGNNAISLICDTGEPFAFATTNTFGTLNSNEAILDTNNLPEVVDLFLKYKLGHEVGMVYQGFCSYPIFEIDFDELKKYERGEE